MAATSKFWDHLADRYAGLPIADEEAYQTKLRVTLSHMRPEMEVLEFGCGTGGTALAHAPHVAHIRAIDFSERMLEIARGKAEAAGISTVSFERADIVALPLPDETYDMVLGLSILHLLKDPAAMIAKVHGTLKPGGLFVTSTACLSEIMAAFRFIAPIGRALGRLPLLNFFTSDELVTQFERAGFEIVHRWHPERNKALFLIGRKPG